MNKDADENSQSSSRKERVIFWGYVSMKKTKYFENGKLICNSAE